MRDVTIPLTKEPVASVWRMGGRAGLDSGSVGMLASGSEGRGRSCDRQVTAPSCRLRLQLASFPER